MNSNNYRVCILEMSRKFSEPNYYVKFLRFLRSICKLLKEIRFISFKTDKIGLSDWLFSFSMSGSMTSSSATHKWLATVVKRIKSKVKWICHILILFILSYHEFFSLVIVYQALWWQQVFDSFDHRWNIFRVELF